MREDEYLKSLYAALARENDPQARNQLLLELDRYSENQIKRERTVPAMERR